MTIPEEVKAYIADTSSKEINLLEHKSKGRILSPLGVTGNELSASEIFSDLFQYMSNGSNVKATETIRNKGGSASSWQLTCWFLP